MRFSDTKMYDCSELFKVSKAVHLEGVQAVEN